MDSEKNTQNNAAQQPAQYSYNPNQQPAEESDISNVIIRRKVKSGYNWASAVIIFQVVLVVVAVFIISAVFSSIKTTEIMQQNPDIEYEQLMEKLMEESSSPDFMIIMNSIGCIFADLLAFIIVFFAAKRFKFKELLSKSKVGASSVGLACLAIIGAQGVSMFIQAIATAITGYTGLSEEAASSLSFSENPAINVILILYAVIIGPILEEFMFRGAAMNLLAPVNRNFALIVSSLLFGLMHANFNQIFNAFLLGLILGYIALKSGSIIPSIICHIFANANAFLLSYIFEEKVALSAGEEQAAIYMMIAFAIEAVVGIIAAVVLWKRHGKVTQDDCVTSYTYELDEAKAKKLAVPALLKSPTFWVAAAYCIYSAVLLVTPVTV